MSTNDKKWYIVWQGETPGVYESWEECRRQVIHRKGARYKSFKGITREEAERILYEEIPVLHTKSSTRKPHLTAVHPQIPPGAVAVDAACSGNPGEMEYRGVVIETGELLFHSQKYPRGTNNIGEFLAIVHALALMERTGHVVPLYTDSRTALSWVRKKAIKTNLPRNAATELLWQHIDRAVQWLHAHDLSRYTITKWETEVLGEIPADFGRK